MVILLFKRFKSHSRHPNGLQNLFGVKIANIEPDFYTSDTGPVVKQASINSELLPGINKFKMKMKKPCSVASPCTEKNM